MNRWAKQIPALLLIVLLGFTPDMALAAGQQAAPQNPPQQATPQDPSQPAESAVQNDSNAEQTATPQSLPDAPSSQAAANQTTSNSLQQSAEGTAAAQAAKTKGGAASKPAGAAIAPAKQHRTRTLLIKIGVIAAAGAALGSVYALTRGSPARPPGAH
jgi:hypothetical protein